MKNNKNHVVYQTYHFYSLEEIAEIEKNFSSDDPTMTDAEITTDVFDTLENVYYEDAVCSLNKKLDNNILGIYDLAFQNGKYTSYVALDNNLQTILNSGESVLGFMVYIGSKSKEIRAIHLHHDGAHFIIYRQFRNSKEAERLKENILNGIPVSEKRIKKHTKSLYDVVCKIVGLKEGAI